MLNNSQRVLNLLRSELEFLKKGGYRRSPSSPWRAPYVFEESPSCPKHADSTSQQRCEDCWLMQFVPRDLHAEAIPCRFVPLTADGITVDSLYRYGTPAEIEDALRSWLRQRIQEIEADQLDARAAHLAS